MISVLSYDRNGKEQKLIEEDCREEVSRRTEEQLRFCKVMKMDELSDLMDGDHITDIMYYEIRENSDVENLQRLRKVEPEALLTLLTSADMSPLYYLKPGVSPDLLLFCPFDRKELRRVNTELFDALMEKLETPDKEESFMWNTRDGKMLIPFHKICYFEAVNKKISLRVGNEEYDFYDSIENLTQNVPPYFVRCYRSFLINSKKIRKVNFSEGYVEMENRICVPVSRTYKQELKQFLK